MRPPDRLMTVGGWRLFLRAGESECDNDVLRRRLVGEGETLLFSNAESIMAWRRFDSSKKFLYSSAFGFLGNVFIKSFRSLIALYTLSFDFSSSESETDSTLSRDVSSPPSNSG